MSSSSSVFGVLIICVVLYYLQMYMVGDKCHSEAKIDGKVVIVTGANSGIGLETARDLVERGGTVIMACRDDKRCAEAVKDVATTTKKADKVKAMHLDLGSFMSIRAFAAEFKEKFKHLDILINNAGVLSPPSHLTTDGYEQTMGINHLGHFLLTNLLVPTMLTPGQSGRIITLTSPVHWLTSLNVTNNMDVVEEGTLPNYILYAKSKLANLLFSFELSNKLKDTKINTYAVSPGVVATNLFKNTILGNKYVDQIMESAQGLFVRGPALGAASSICAAVDEEIGKQSGLHYYNCEAQSVSAGATDVEDARIFWDHSAKLVNLSKKEKEWIKELPNF